MTDLVSLLFIAMIPIDFKITNFSLHLYIEVQLVPSHPADYNTNSQATLYTQFILQLVVLTTQKELRL